MKKLLIISLALLTITADFILISCQIVVSKTSLLQGVVTIGPITPIEQPGQCPPVSSEVFNLRKIMIYDESGEELVQTISIIQIGQTVSGYYTVLLAPGTYAIDINHVGIDRADNLPQKITMYAGETISIDINIDTGIR